jgi:hypothetical protein
MTAEQRRLMAVLAHTGGDHVDSATLLCACPQPPQKAAASPAKLLRWSLVQTPWPRRYALHAVVR